MLLQNGRRNARLSSFILDIVHIVIGCLIALLAVLAFWDPDRNKVLFPFIFLLGSVLYLITGINQAVSYTHLNTVPAMNPQRSNTAVSTRIIIRINFSAYPSSKLDWE